MYSRKLDKVPEFLIENSKPKFGSYIGTPKSLSISGIKFPYGIIPLPKWITNLRIRSNFTFVFDTEDYLGSLDIIDMKLAGFYEVNLWHKESNHRYSYRGVTGIHRHLVPKNMNKGVCSTYRKIRYVRIVWDKERNRFTFVFRLRGDGIRPNFSGNFIAPYGETESAFTSVLPYPTMRRCYVSYQRPFLCDSGIQAAKTDTPFFHSEKSLCLLISTRAYFKFRTVSKYVVGIGKVDNHEVLFRISNVSNLPKNSDDNNENVLFYDGQVTALPYVMITHTFGVSKKWVIQDTEGMVDLVFTPKSVRQKFVSAIVLEGQYNFIFGTYEGVIVTKDGKSIMIKDFPGVAKNMRTRL